MLAASLYTKNQTCVCVQCTLYMWSCTCSNFIVGTCSFVVYQSKLSPYHPSKPVGFNLQALYQPVGFPSHLVFFSVQSQNDTSVLLVHTTTEVENIRTDTKISTHQHHLSLNILTPWPQQCDTLASTKEGRPHPRLAPTSGSSTVAHNRTK